MEEDIRAYCISKWEASSSDERIKQFTNNYPAFMENKSPEMKKCIELLLKEFEYYSHNIVNDELFCLHNDLLRKYHLDIDVSLFAVLQSQRSTYNSSYEYLGEYKAINSLSKYNVVPELSSWFNKEYWGNVENIVFVDDFCGSGKTFIDYIESIKEHIRDKNIYYVVIHMMSAAKDRINDYAKSNNIDVTVVTYHITDAAFSINDELEASRDLFKEESSDLGIKSSEIFGFDNTESLVAFHENSPNNTLGLFIKDTSENVALFPREIDKKPSLMTIKNKKKKKQESNYVCKSKSFKR